MFKASPAGGLGAAALIGVLAGLPLAARAQVYKCAQANGTVGYQGTPCPTRARPYDDPYAKSADSPGNAQAPSPRAPPSPTGVASVQPPSTSTSRLVAEVQARNRREAQQQAWKDAHGNDKVVNLGACNAARYNLPILNEQRLVYSYDKAGNRVYVEDKDRAAKIAETQRTIAATCP
jgi:hypothetical protein